MNYLELILDETVYCEKVFTLVLITLIPLSSLAFNSSTRCLKISGLYINFYISYIIIYYTHIIVYLKLI